MAGIAGILKNNEVELVSRMLGSIAHRGNHGRAVDSGNGATIGIVWSHHEEPGVTSGIKTDRYCDGPGFGQLTEVTREHGSWQIRRDELGVSPMYIAKTQDEVLCFASEVKALLEVSGLIREIPPGHIYTEDFLYKYFSLEEANTDPGDRESLAMELNNLLSLAVVNRITSDTMGSWLSGGLDSSAIAVLARPWLKNFHTFAGGISGAPDLEYARAMAHHLQSDHHEIIVELKDMLRVLPLVIYHLESFDALLVRSSIINYLVGEAAAGWVEEVFSGEGGDELFGGYSYLKQIPESELNKELTEITGRLHNTALQRVDRCSSAHGLTAHVVFADPDLVNFAMRVPAGFKIRNGIEKWILRESLAGLLPEKIARRPKAKFWEGAGVQQILSDYADAKVTSADFDSGRMLENGWTLNTKEEYLYYRIFTDFFGGLDNLEWMGRTKGSPVS